MNQRPTLDPFARFAGLDSKSRSLVIATLPAVGFGLSNYVQTLIADPPHDRLLLLAGPFLFVGCFLVSAIVILAGHKLLCVLRSARYPWLAIAGVKGLYFTIGSVAVMASLTLATTVFRALDQFDTAYPLLYREILVSCLPIWAAVYSACLLLILALDRRRLPTAPSVRGESITVMADRKVHQLKAEDIRYVQAQGNYIEIVCAARRLTVRQSLGDFLSGFTGTTILRVHRSFAVNPSAILRLQRSPTGTPEMVLTDGTRLPVGRRRLGDIRALLLARG